jgi:hypothetical protein
MRHICGNVRSRCPRWLEAVCGGLLLLAVDTAAALDIASRQVSELDGAGSKRLRLVLSGRILPGDAAKLARVFATLPLEQFDGVVLNSPGGVGVEGHRLGELLEHLLVRVIVREPFRCASACFSMYAGAAMRGAQGPPHPVTLTVHREFLLPQQAARLSIENLEQLLELEQNEKPRWYAKRGVPQHVIDYIVSGVVAPVVQLSQSDIDDIRPRSPGYDAWIEARCPGSGKVAAWTVRELPTQVADQQLAHAEERRQCEVKRVDAERRYRQFALQTALDVGERRMALRGPAAAPFVGVSIPGR